MARILLGVPTRFNQVEWGCAARALSLATRRHSYTICQSRMSLLPTNCNTLLAQALNFRPKCDYFAMLHSDVEPAEYWLDTLIEQAEAHSADLMSAIVAFKDGTGLTSTAIARPDMPLSTFCRLTLGQIWHEGFPATFGLGEAVEALAKLPAPYGIASVPQTCLLVNTGCMVYRLSHWQPGVKFANLDELVQVGDEVQVHYLSEDWYFARSVAEHGGKVMATRTVRTIHHGDALFDSGKPHGQPRDLLSQALHGS